MIRFLYTGAYATDSSDYADPADLLQDARLFVVAGKYSLDALQRRAVEVFKKRCQTHWRSHCFAKAVEYVNAASLDMTPLKDIIHATVRQHGDLTNGYRDPDASNDDVDSLMNFNEDLPGRRPHDVVEPTRTQFILYRWKFTCPGTDERECKNTFFENIPLGQATSLKCPLGHNRRSFDFWIRYGQDASRAYDQD